MLAVLQTAQMDSAALQLGAAETARPLTAIETLV
jgi:hypothetical protein